jgi:antitoxin (DNA-binding transcriptional repressor) of toxin-antitoxin stability system
MTRETEITATEAARSFSDLLSRVRYAGESFLVVRNGEVMCRIEPAGPARRTTVGDLLDALEGSHARDDRFANDLEEAQNRQPQLPPSPWAS